MISIRFLWIFWIVFWVPFWLTAEENGGTSGALDGMKGRSDKMRQMQIPKAEKILVVKSERKLYLLRGGKPYREYHVALGGSPEGPKRQEHDQKTPEGNYTLDFKKPDSAYYRAIHISYPNARDKAWAKKRGVSPGGAIMIHGQPNWWGWLAPIRQRFDWTAGCIAVSNGDMDEIWEAVVPGTPIEIRP